MKKKVAYESHSIDSFGRSKSQVNLEDGTDVNKKMGEFLAQTLGSPASITYRLYFLSGTVKTPTGFPGHDAYARDYETFLPPAPRPA